MVNKWILCTAFLFLGACAQKAKKPDQNSSLLFPHGTYQKRVKVQIAQPSRNVDLKSVVESHPETFKVVGLSRFNTTLFTIEENLTTGEVQKEFYVDIIKRNEDRFMFFYSLLKEMLLAPKGPTDFEKQGAKFALSRPDENQIYRAIDVQHPQVNLLIEVTDYTF